MRKKSAPNQPIGLPIGISRRALLQAAAIGPAVAALGVGAASGTAVAAVQAAAALPNGIPSIALHSHLDLAYSRAAVSAGVAPWVAGYDRLSTNWHAGAGWTPTPLETVVRGGTGQNYTALFRDAHAAYQNALMWRLTGIEAHGAKAVEILNAWAATLTTITGNADTFLAAGIYGYQMANAAQLVKQRADLNTAAVTGMLVGVFYQRNNEFLLNHNGAVVTNYWANWDLCNMASVLAIGIFAGRDDLINQALGYFDSGAGNGSLQNAIPFLHPDGLAQWQESGRDQAHSIMGIGLMAAFCEMAWSLGVDCYGADDNRFYKAAQYVAKYNIGQDVPFSPYTWRSGPLTQAPHVGWNTQTEVSYAGRGQVRPVWEMILGHYQGRRGLASEWIAQAAALSRPEGGGSQYGSNSGGYDALGFGTLLHHARTTPVRLESRAVPGAFVRHRSFLGFLEPSPASLADSQFRAVTGRASSADGRVSFESTNHPGRFLRHSSFALRLDPADSTANFAGDSTFVPVQSTEDHDGLLFISHNYPDRAIRSVAGQLRIEPFGTAEQRAAATFAIRL